MPFGFAWSEAIFASSREVAMPIEQNREDSAFTC
jgi:hypothetical protein